MAKRHMFLRDYTKANKHPVGCVVVEADRATNQIRYALSVCSPLDKWNSRVANDKANGRFQKAPLVIEGAIPEHTHDITRLVMQDIVKNHSKQGGKKSRSMLALLAAEGWLANSQQFTETTEKLVA